MASPSQVHTQTCGSLDIHFSRCTNSVYQLRAPVIKWSSGKGGGWWIRLEDSGPWEPPSNPSHCVSALPVFPLCLFLSALLYIFPSLPFSHCFSFIITQPADSGGGGFSRVVGLSSRPCLVKLMLQNRQQIKHKYE